jgi:hypothetical protein
VSGKTKNMMRQLATTVFHDRTATTREKQLARGLLLLMDGVLPK